MNHPNSTPSSPDNPLLLDWLAPYGLPPFEHAQPEYFESAFDVAMVAQRAELDAIAGNPAPATFANTLQALDQSARLYNRLELLFSNLTLSETSPALQVVQRAMAPRLAAHENAVYMNAALFGRIDSLYQQRQRLALDAQDLRLLERVHLDFVRAGAQLSGANRQRYGAVVEELAAQYTAFSQNVLADENSFLLELQGDADLAGLPDFLREATRAAAAQRGLAEDSHAVSLSPSLTEPFLTFSARRDLREKVWRERSLRGAHQGATDNRAIIARIMALRQEQAQLLGYANYADYELADRMAGNTAAVLDLLSKAWEPAKARAQEDRAALTAMAASLGEPTPIAAWDWRYLAEKVRVQAFDLDDAAVKPYFTLDNMIAAMFDCAGRLFGLRFVEQHGLSLYHPDVRAWEVQRADGTQVGLFLGDNYARPSKRSGAWMSIFRSQSGHKGGTLPIVINNNNFAKASPTLLSFDDVKTLFHEFGHGLHGLLSQVRHERLAGTSVLRDYVELPSQLFENWALERDVLQRHACHFESGEPLPEVLLEKLLAARRFNQAWATLMYTGPALIDMALHSLPNGTPVDIMAFEAEQCRLLGVPQDIGLRHHLSHFQHLFAHAGYAAGYYVYMWAEVLEADAFDAFKQTGNAFDAATAQRLQQQIYSAGNSTEPAQGFRNFRGRDPQVEPMLRKRGLLAS
jgi:peptidyl-dipeptidase Dcp